MRKMAERGYSSHQIAATCHLTVEACRRALRKAGIAVPADKLVGRRRQHDANRIVDTMVMQAEYLCADVNLIDFAKLDPVKRPEWRQSLKASLRALTRFIRRLS